MIHPDRKICLVAQYLGVSLEKDWPDHRLHLETIAQLTVLELLAQQSKNLCTQRMIRTQVMDALTLLGDECLAKNVCIPKQPSCFQILRSKLIGLSSKR